MRLRVLGVLSLVSLLLVIGVSYALMSSASRELTQELQINRVAALNRFAQVAYDAALTNNSAQLKREMDRYSELYGEGILVRLQDETLRSGALNEQRDDVRLAISNASLNLSDTALSTVVPFGTGSEIVSRSFGNANQVLGLAVLEVNPDLARQKLRERWLIIAAAAATLAVLLLLLTARITGWVLRPVQRLNSALAELAGTGRTSRLPEDGPPELRELTHSFTRMAQKVAASMESQRQLIADTSHELRNPVAALRLRTDLLQLELQSPVQLEAAAGVLAEVERVEKILDGVLKLAAAEHRASAGWNRAGNPVGHTARARTNPFTVLQEEVERAAPAALRSHADLALEAGPATIELDCNPDELAQMVGELVNNAIKYAPASRITAALRLLPNLVVIEIADDGPGLPAEQRTAALARFWRAPQHRALPGNGLGMAIVQRLAEANGARLVLAERLPHGLVASLEFPYRPESGASDA